MKYKFAIGLFLLAFLFGGCARDSDEVAQIGDFVITRTQFMKSYRDFLFRTGLKDNLKVRSSYLNSLIDEQSILIYADSSGYRQRRDVAVKLSRLSDQVCINYFFKNYIYPDLKISDDEVRKAYIRSLVEIHARHLYAPDLNEARILRQRLEDGESFEELAQRVFKDPYLASHGGDLGWFSYGEMEASFEDTAYSLNIGEISAPVKTKYGYSIIQVLNRRYNPFVREDDFQRKRKWLLLELRRRKLDSFVQEKTDAILDQLELKINRKVLLAIYGLSAVLMDDSGRLSVEQFRRETGGAWVIRSRGEIWTDEVVLSRLKEVQKRQWERMKDVSDLEKILKGLAIRAEVERSIARLGIRDIPEVRREIEKVCNHKVIALLLDSLMDVSLVPDSVLLTSYIKNPDKYMSPEMAEISEIGVFTRDKALRLLGMLESGEDFSRLAKEYSVLERSRFEGGYLGWDNVARFGTLKEQIRSAEVGDILGPFEIGGIFILIQIKGKKASRPLAFEEAKSAIRENERQKLRRKAYFEFLCRVKKNLTIKINQHLLKTITLQEQTGKT